MSTVGDDVKGILTRDKQRKRSSILKQTKSPNRSALQDLDQDLNLQVDDEFKPPRANRRVSFAEKYQIKEYCVDSVPFGNSNITALAPITGSDESSNNNTTVDTSNRRICGLDSLLSGKIQNHIESSDELPPIYYHYEPQNAAEKRKFESTHPDLSEENCKKQRNSDKTTFFDDGNDMSFTQVHGGISEDVKFSSQFILRALINTISQETEKTKKDSLWNEDKENMCSIFSTDDEMSEKHEGEKSEEDMEFTECVNGVFVENKSVQMSQKEKRRTILFDDGEDMEFTQVAKNVFSAVGEPEVKSGTSFGRRSEEIDEEEYLEMSLLTQKERRKTILFDDGEEMEFTEVATNVFPVAESGKMAENERNSPKIDEKLEEFSEVSQKERRKTILFDDGEEMEFTEVAKNVFPVVGEPEVMSGTSFGRGKEEIDENSEEFLQMSQKERGKTILFDDGGEMEFTEVAKNVFPVVEEPEVKSGTSFGRRNEEIDEEEYLEMSLLTQKERRKTILFDDGEEMEFTEVATNVFPVIESGKIAENASNPKKNDENSAEVLEMSQKERRKAILFKGGEEMELKEVTTNVFPVVESEKISQNARNSMKIDEKSTEFLEVNRNERRKTILFDDGEQMEFTEVGKVFPVVENEKIDGQMAENAINSAKIVENSAEFLEMSRNERRKTILFHEGEEMEFTEVATNVFPVVEKPEVKSEMSFGTETRNNEHENEKTTDISNQKTTENLKKCNETDRKSVVLSPSDEKVEQNSQNSYSSQKINRLIPFFDDESEKKLANCKYANKIFRPDPNTSTDPTDVATTSKIDEMEEKWKSFQERAKLDPSRAKFLKSLKAIYEFGKSTPVRNRYGQIVQYNSFNNSIRVEDMAQIPEDFHFSPKKTVIVEDFDESDENSSEICVEAKDCGKIEESVKNVENSQKEPEERKECFKFMERLAKNPEEIFPPEKIEKRTVRDPLAPNPFLRKEMFRNERLFVPNSPPPVIRMEDQDSSKNDHVTFNLTSESTAVLFNDASQMLKSNQESSNPGVLGFLLRNEESLRSPEVPETPEDERFELECEELTQRSFMTNLSRVDFTEEMICDVDVSLLSSSGLTANCPTPEVMRGETKVTKKKEESKILDENVRMSCVKVKKEKNLVEKKREDVGVGVGKVGNDDGSENCDENDEEFMMLALLDAANGMMDSTIKVEQQFNSMFDSIPTDYELKRIQQLDEEIQQQQKKLEEKNKQLATEREQVEALRLKKESLQIQTDSVTKQKEEAIASFEEFKKKVWDVQERAEREWRYREGDFESHDETGFCISYFNASLLLRVDYGHEISAPECLKHLPSYKVTKITLKPNLNKPEKTNLSQFCHWLILNAVNQEKFLEKSPTTHELYKVLNEMALAVGAVRLFVYDLETVAETHRIKVEDKTLWINFNHIKSHVLFQLAFNFLPNTYSYTKITPKIEITVGKPELEQQVLAVVDSVEPSARYICKIVSAVQTFLDTLH